MDIFSDIEYWQWLIFGLVLLVVEIFVAGAILLWLGLSALLIGILAFTVPTLSFPILVVLWGLFSVAGVMGWQFYKKKNPSPVAEYPMNRRGEQYVGRHYTLAHDVINGSGEMHVDDTRWKIVAAKDLPAGTKVKVVDVEGTSLRVEETLP
jgi:membrane protein implicated in regulation of membrane protease activity